MARKVHIAFVATPGRGFSRSRSCIARKPSGVAAFANPNMFAAMFITIEPIAGWLAGTSGNNHRMIGRRAAARKPTRPDFSAKRITPSHKAIMPARGKASVITAVLQASKAAPVISASCPDIAPRRTASRTSPSQIQLSIGGQFVSRSGPLAQKNFAERRKCRSRRAAGTEGLGSTPVSGVLSGVPPGAIRRTLPLDSISFLAKDLSGGHSEPRCGNVPLTRTPDSHTRDGMRRRRGVFVGAASSRAEGSRPWAQGRYISLPATAAISVDRTSSEGFPDRLRRRILPVLRQSICSRANSWLVCRSHKTLRRVPGKGRFASR